MAADLNTLHPKVADLARQLIEAMAVVGVDLRVTQALRTIAEQEALYAKGRTTPGRIVTNARGGYSYHNYGLAFDVVPVIGGKAEWNDMDLWQTIGRAGKEIGLEWGGDFRTFKDMPHFQFTFGMSLADLRSKKPIPKE